MKKALALMLSLVMCLSLAACGSGNSGSAGNDNSNTQPEETAAPAAEEAEASASAEEAPADTAAAGSATEISLWHYFDASADAQAIVEWVDEYNSLQDDIHITATYVSRAELMNQYTIGALSGELPDIGMVDSPDMASYISLGVFEDITDELNAWGELDKFYPGPLSSCMDSEGKLYGLPQNTNCLALEIGRASCRERV